jgi:hypothetical protein
MRALRATPAVSTTLTSVRSRWDTASEDLTGLGDVVRVSVVELFDDVPVEVRLVSSRRGPSRCLPRSRRRPFRLRSARCSRRAASFALPRRKRFN